MGRSGRCTLVFPRTSRRSRSKRLVRVKGVGVDVSNALWNPRQQGGRARVFTRVVPNNRLQATAYSVRSSVAPASSGA